VNREVKSRSALLALARTRRMQRAVAHAYIYRDAPMPSLRLSLGFMTGTVCTADDVGERGHRMQLLGLAAAEGVAYVVEELGGGEPPIVYRLWLRGARAGHLVPIRTWYEGGGDVSDREIRARIASIATTLEPLAPTTPEAWMLSTRVVQRRALKLDETLVSAPAAPIRKYALQLRVEPVSGHGPSGHTTVTAFLQPSASLADVWALPDGGAIARVTYTGIPSGLGLPKDTVVLLTE
jgi:hypothetical protein